MAKVVELISRTHPFSSLFESDLQKLSSSSRLVNCDLGTRILRPDDLPRSVYLVLEGKIRSLANTASGSQTLNLIGPGQMFGWSSLLCAEPFEWIIASESSVLLEIPAECFVSLYKTNKKFADYFSSTSSLQEAFRVNFAVEACNTYKEKNWQLNGLNRVSNSLVLSHEQGIPFVQPSDVDKTVSWFMSTSGVPGFPVGTIVNNGDKLPVHLD